jgi:hypothetical protein
MSRDLRRYASQTQVQLLAGFVLLLLVIGDGLIYVFYGKEAAIFGVICSLIGLAPLVLIWLVMLVIGIVARKAGKD